jgi:diaminohydroxyphosphoribosylaminopyrimidine deaminase/5-amino-6-(5-phosphoribosylamino)uracil reductase
MGSFLRERLVDELILYFSPRMLGSSAISFSGIQDIEKLSKKIKFSVSDMIEINQDLKLTLESQYV